jgi:hypothetical protein
LNDDTLMSFPVNNQKMALDPTGDAGDVRVSREDL